MGFRLVAGALFGIGMAALAGPVQGETWSWTCQAVLRTPDYMRAGSPFDTWPKTPVEVTAEARAGGRVTVRSAVVDVDLVAEDPDDPELAPVYGGSTDRFVAAYGTAEAVLFDRGSVNACIDRIRAARPAVFESPQTMASDEELGRCYEQAPMMTAPGPADVALDLREEKRGSAVHRYFHMTFWHEGEDLDDVLQYLRQMNFNGPCEPK